MRPDFAEPAAQWQGSVNITKGTMAQVNAIYNSARLTPQGEYAPSYVVNLGMRQELMANKLSVVLTAADVFKTLRRDVTVSIPTLAQTVVNTRDARVLYLGLTYNLGTSPKKEKEGILKYDNGL